MIPGTLTVWRRLPRSFLRSTVVPVATAALIAFAAAAPSQAQERRPAAEANGDVDPGTKKLLAATGLFNRGPAFYKPAAQAFQQFLEEYPDHPQATTARYALAVCHYRLEEHDKAVALLGTVLKDRKFEQRDEALAVLGHSQLSAGKYEEALAAFDELLAKHAKSKHAEVAALNRAQVLYLDKQYDKAAAAAGQFLKQFPESAERPAGMYFLALSQKAQDQNDKAAETLAELLSKHPDSRYKLDAALLLGQSLEAQGELEEAAEQYRRMAAAAPAARQGDARYSLGVVLYKAGKYDEAAKELAAVVDEGAEGKYAKPARLQLGMVQLAGGKAADARRTLERAVAEGQFVNEAKYGLAQCDIAEKKFEAARRTLGELLEQDPPPPNAAQVALDRAVCAAELGNHQEAAEEFAALTKNFANAPQAGEALYRQAFSLHKLGKYAESHALCEKLAGGGAKEFAGPAAELDAENLFLMGKYSEAAKAFAALSSGAKDEDKKLDFALRLGQCAYFAGDYPRAVDLLKPVADAPKAAKSEERGRGVFLLGDALLQQGKHEEAAAALQKYLPVAKGDKQEAQYKLALAQLRAGDAAAAQKNLAAVASGPGDSAWTARALLEVGQLAYKSDPPKLKEAEAALTKVLSGDPPEELAAPALYLLGWVDFDSKKHPDAAEKWAKVAADYPKHKLAADAAFQKGVALREAGKHEEALAAFTAYTKANPDGEHVTRARQLSAAALTDLKRHDEAKKMLESLAGDKGGDAVLYDLAWAHKNTDDKSAAEATYRRLIKEFPDSPLAPAARTELSEFLYADKKYDEAAQLLEAALKAEKIDPRTKAAATYRLGWCYEKMGKAEQAAATFGKVGESADAGEDVAASALLQAGIAYAAREKYGDAARSLKQMLEKFPRHGQASVAMLKLGEVQADAGDFADSHETYRQFLEKHAGNPFAYRAHFGIGWALENQKKYAEAREAYAKVIASNNGETAARAQFQTGETLLAEGKFQDAVIELLKVEDVYKYPKWSARALLETGKAFEQLQQKDQAKQQYTEVITKYKDAPEAGVAQDRLKTLKG